MSDSPLTDPTGPRACDHCGAQLDALQEVCVECGHATPSARANRLRRALPTASLAGFAVLLAASAAYGLTAGRGNVRDLGLDKPPPPPAVANAAPTPPSATPSPAP